MKIILLLAFMTPSSWGLTLSTIRDDCRVLVQDTGSSRRRFSDAQLLRFVNEGQKDLVMWAKPIRKPYTFELVAGTTYYSMPSDFLSVERLTRSHQVLKEESIKSLDKGLQWQTVAGLPIAYYLNHSSRSLIGFYPFPGTTSSTGTIRMEYNATAVDFSADANEPFNGIDELQPYGYLIAFYCGYRASLVDGQGTQAQAYYAEYRRGSDMLANDAFARPNYRPQASGAVNGVQ